MILGCVLNHQLLALGLYVSKCCSDSVHLPMDIHWSYADNYIGSMTPNESHHLNHEIGLYLALVNDY